MGAGVQEAQQPLQTLLVGVDRRAVTSLNGDWHYLVDQPPARELYDGDGKVKDSGYAEYAPEHFKRAAQRRV